MTFREFKKLWALPADIRARTSRIEAMRRKADSAAVVQDTVQGSGTSLPFAKHTVMIRGVAVDTRLDEQERRLHALNEEYDRLYDRALIEIEDITDPEVRVAVSRRSFDGWSWSEVALELGVLRDADAVRKAVYEYFKQQK